jgi:hypothetical protein
MKKILHLTLAGLAWLAVLATPLARAWTYQDGNALLIFRETGFDDVEFDIGSISQFLNRSNGYKAAVTGWNLTAVTNVFGSDLTGVSVILAATTSWTNSSANRISWLTSSASVTTVNDVTSSAWQANLWSTIDNIGALPESIAPSATSDYVLASTDQAAYDYIVTGGGVNGSSIAELGGKVPFSVEGIVPDTLGFWQIQPSTAVPKPAANYVGTFSIDASGNLTFQAGVPQQPTETVTWSAPSSIPYGTALSSIQLNASANVPGSFSYSPATGALLQAGTNALTVVFTPTNLVEYASVTNSVSLVVSPAALTITANNRTKTYGQAVSFAGTEFTAAGLTNGDSVVSVSLTSAGSVATATVAGSPYPIVPSAATGTGLGNYSITYTNGALTVAPAALTITANNRTKTYGQAVSFAGTEFTAAGLTNSDAVTNVTLTSAGSAATATVAGSPYPIVPSAAIGTGLGNYAIAYVNGVLTVTNAQLSIQSAIASSNLFIFTWSAVATETYQVQYRTDLSQGIWINLGSPVTATNSSASASNGITNSQAFYRIQVVP